MLSAPLYHLPRTVPTARRLPHGFGQTELPQARVLLIGVGLHARKNYLAVLREHPHGTLVAAVDRIDNLSETGRFVRAVNAEAELIGASRFKGDVLPEDLRLTLDAAVTRLRVNAVMICTPPEMHWSYLDWAVEAGLHVFVDKPMVGFEDLSNDPKLGRMIRSSFDYLTTNRHRHQTIAIGVQRRHHAAFKFVAAAVEEAARACGTPITAISSEHDDGQFRPPSEFESLGYHGYNQGMGKLMHSGTHEVDVQAWLIGLAASTSHIGYESLETHATSVRPAGFLQQYPRRVFERIWGAETWAKLCPDSDGVMKKRFAAYGELDLMATTTFRSQREVALISTITLLHNSVSRRSWPTPNMEDLYKMQGRIKHETHTIRQGPFQKIVIQSYQAKDNHDHNDRDEYAFGGNNHFDIHIFRNPGLWPYEVQPLEMITGLDIARAAGLSDSRLLTSHAKDQMLAEFFECVTGRRNPVDHASDLEKLRLTTTMMGTIAESMARHGRTVPAPILIKNQTTHREEAA
jgi:hypothetical protein